MVISYTDNSLKLIAAESFQVDTFIAREVYS